MALRVNHPERNVIHLQLRHNDVLKTMSDDERSELEQRLDVVDIGKGDYLVHQGVHEMEQYFVIGGILKRVVANADAKEMILRFAPEHDIETSYAAWRLNTPTPLFHRQRHQGAGGQVADAAMGAVHGPAPALQGRVRVRGDARDEREHGAHHDAASAGRTPGREHCFMRKHAELAERIPKKQLAAYLNPSAQALSRLKQRGKI